MSNWNYLNGHRCRVETPTVSAHYLSDDSDGFNGMFRLPLLNGTTARCVAGDGMDWQHVSVTIENDNRPPRWNIMCMVKDLFWEPEDWVVQFHPAKSEYVNHHPGCLHLWRYIGTEFKQPIPKAIMVGPKS